MPENNGNSIDRLKESSVFIRSTESSGSGYLVAPQRIATALHVVRHLQPGQRVAVTVGVGGPTVEATLLRSDPEADAAVLGFQEDLMVAALPVAKTLVRDVAWTSYGFPTLADKTGLPVGLPIDGRVMDARTRNDVGQSAVLLYSDQIAAGNASPLHGFSGGPIVVAGALVGHLTKHIGDADDKRRAAYGYVYACPIDEVVKLLDVEPLTVEIAPSPIETRAESIPHLNTNEYHVFVSYRSTDRAWAMSLVARLEGAGLRVFIDQRELKPGEYLAGQLESALKRSRAAVVLVSQDWLESPWCQQEANVLVKRAVEDAKFKLVPLRVGDVSMPTFLDTRVWVDFKGSKRAEGPKLDSLLSVLADLDPGRDPRAVRADAADVRVTDRFVAEIMTAAKGDGRRILAVLDEWRKTELSDSAPLIKAAEVFNGKGLFESALEMLKPLEPTVRVRQLRAFALRKKGDVDEAIHMLEALHREGVVDPETGGLLAGCYKQRWLDTDDPAFKQLTYRTYLQTYERFGDAFNGINAAAMALQCDDVPRMFQTAGKVRDALLTNDEATLPHWDLATLGEACLLLGKFDDAREWYGKAVAKAAGLHDNIAMMRRQARLNLSALGKPPDWLDDLLTVPHVLAYFGHMTDADDRPSPRFPQSKVSKVRKAIRDRVIRYGNLYGFGQAARGTDLIVLEELVSHGRGATVVLPMPEADFVAISVGDQWKARFDKVKATGRVQFCKPLRDPCPPDAELGRALEEANREVQKRALEFARRLDETPIVLAVWDRQQGDGPGGTADAIRLWQDDGFEVDVIDVGNV
ncbi:TIR domain-containing protein [Paraburkholderia sp. RL17-337-BIB-A]|uniref:TIR domain-containing protein n=1 Tax=Paraburkholderia sp. RL17-337-BIB-A TaxID=3031636 RepID=UPI0038B94020